MDKPIVFMIMPFRDEFFEVYEMLKTKFANDFEFTHAGDDVATQQNILKDIIQQIYDADVIIADLTDLNPNVFYELGIAHAFNKKVINITRDVSSVPFDIKSYRATEYSTHFLKFDNMITDLTRFLNGAIDGSVAFGNPVTDFLSEKGLTTLSGATMPKTTASDIESRGFIDFLADIEDDMVDLTEKTADISNGLQVMSAGISKSTKEIERVKKAGGSGTTSFVRKEARKAAKYIEDYSLKLQTYNVESLTLWTTIERNILSLVDNEHIATPENREGLLNFFAALSGMKNGINFAKEAKARFRDSIKSVKGMQASLTQASTVLDVEVSKFVDFAEQMVASVDRILDKNKFIIGDVDLEQRYAEIQEGREETDS